MLRWLPIVEKTFLLILSDSHIPERASDIDKPILDFLRSKAYDIVVHAGDLTEEYVLQQVRLLGSRCYVVQGNMDYLELPENEVFEVYDVRVGVIHGDQVRPRGNVKALTTIAKNLGVQILVSGHTHSPFIVFDPSGVLHVNPGSVTGVWGGGGGSMVPSFIEIEISEDKLVYVKLYELIYGRVLLRKEEVYRFT